MVDDPDSVLAAMRAGARGYLLKGADREQLLRGVAAVSRGEVIFGPAVAAHVLRSLATRDAAGPRAFPQLSERELDVLELIADGRDNTTIARRLGLSPKTVRNHVSILLTKLEVPDRSAAIVRARQAGLGTGPPA